jgi:hypothetical protein
MSELRIAYVAEGNVQHAFPIEALLKVWPAPVFTTGERSASRLRAHAEVHVQPAASLAAALRARGVQVVISTSQVLSPALLRGADAALRCVFVGHGESDKTHDDRLQERFVWNPINAQFDLMLVATHAHLHDQRNPNKRLVGYLKHDLFVARGHAGRAPDARRVLWAPGWGRHNSARHHLARVVDACARLELELDVHLHPHSYDAESDLTRRVQLESLRNEHVRVIQCADILQPMARSALLLGDVSSVCYDWLLFDRPIVFLDHSGLSIAEEKALFDVGAVAAPGDDLCALLAAELAAPADRSQLRKARLDARFFKLDGRAAERALAEVVRAAREDWGIAC